MTPESLLEQFDVMAEAPNGVPKLREMILQLAVRGKLVPHDTEGERSCDSLNVNSEARKSADAPRLRRSQSLKAFTALEQLELPESWQSTRLGDVVKIQNGFAFDSAYFNGVGDGVPLIRIRDLAADRTTVSYSGLYREEFLVVRGDYLIGMDGNFELHEWRGERALLNQRVCRLLEFSAAVDRRFVFWTLQVALDEIHSGTSFVTVKHLSSKSVASIRMPLPPLAEQRRIAAKVDELMTLCDQLAARQQRRAELRLRANRALLHQFVQASGDQEMAARCKRLRESFPFLYDAPEVAVALREAIVELAIRGRLVLQDPNDEPASVLLRRVVADRKRRLGEETTGDPRGIEPISDDQLPFPARNGWSWVRLHLLVTNGPRNGYSPKPVNYETATRTLTLTATTSGNFDERHFKYIAESFPDDSPYWLLPGDLLFQRGNSTDYVGTAAIYTGAARDFIYPDLMIRVRCSPEVDLEFVRLVANSRIGRAHFVSRASGTSGSMPKISQKDVVELPVPVPPLAEQRRIVAKVNELMTLCDALESRLTHAREKSAHLAASVVHHLGAA